MNTISFTPTDRQAAGFSYANAKARAVHESAQSAKPESERVAYTVTDEQYALNQLARIADSYFQQKVEAIGEANWPLVVAVATYKDSDAGVAAKLAELQAAVENAQAR